MDRTTVRTECDGITVGYQRHGLNIAMLKTESICMFTITTHTNRCHAISHCGVHKH